MLGADLSIHVMFAVFAPVFPYASVKVKSYVQLLVKVYVHELVMVTHVLLNPVISASTLPLVRPVVEYSIVPVTGDLSIRFTVAVSLHEFPYMSWNVKVNESLPVKVCVVVLSPVIVSENPVIVAITS
jgi:hypothetical protein